MPLICCHSTYWHGNSTRHPLSVTQDNSFGKGHMWPRFYCERASSLWRRVLSHFELGLQYVAYMCLCRGQSSELGLEQCLWSQGKHCTHKDGPHWDVITRSHSGEPQWFPFRRTLLRSASFSKAALCASHHVCICGQVRLPPLSLSPLTLIRPSHDRPNSHNSMTLIITRHKSSTSSQL